MHYQYLDFWSNMSTQVKLSSQATTKRAIQKASDNKGMMADITLPFSGGILHLWGKDQDLGILESI